jgi:5-deoxy-glucuronate isomerase
LNLKIRKKLEKGHVSVIEEKEEIKLIHLGILRLEKEEKFDGSALNSRETALVILSGSCDIFSNGQNFLKIGDRRTVFEGPATALYIPAGNGYRIIAQSSLEAAIITAPAQKRGNPVLIKPDQVKIETRGKDNYRRETHDIMVNNVEAETLLVGETFNESGKWSSYPPHKHDEDNLPEEAKLEEVYFYKVYPEQGFGIQRIYSSDKQLDEVYVVENNDVVLIPKGYHPVVAAPGYNLYYLWALAGDKRIMTVREDPQHRWMTKF